MSESQIIKDLLGIVPPLEEDMEGFSRAMDDRERKQAEEALDALRGMAEPEPDRKPRSKYRAGTRLRISYDAIATGEEFSDPDGNWLPVVREEGYTEQPWFEWLPSVTVEVIPPDVSPGTIITAGGVTWVVRKSNPRDSLRVMPVDLSGKLRTLPIEEFFTKYQAAKIRWTPESLQADG